jgi:hypothetical protein
MRHTLHGKSVLHTRVCLQADHNRLFYDVDQQTLCNRRHEIFSWETLSIQNPTYNSLSLLGYLFRLLLPSAVGTEAHHGRPTLTYVYIHMFALLAYKRSTTGISVVLVIGI